MAIIECNGRQLDTDNLPAILTEEDIACLQEWALEEEANNPPAPVDENAIIQQERRIRRKVVRWMEGLGADDEIINFIIGSDDLQDNTTLNARKIDARKIDPKEFPRMSQAQADLLADSGISTVEELASALPLEIDEMPIPSVGEKTARLWVDTARNMT